MRNSNEKRSPDAATSPAPKKTSMARALLFRLILLAVGLGFALALCEVTLIVLGIGFPSTSISDDHRGTARRPGAKWQQKSEGNASIEINQAGFRDTLRAKAKPDNCYRIVVLGDSFVEAVQVEEHERFTELLQNRLNDLPLVEGQQVEVLNFGMGGYGTTQEFQTWKYVARNYEPDLVIVAFLSGNDIRNNSRELQNDAGRPYHFVKDGELHFDDSFLTSSDHQKTTFERTLLWCMDYSRVLQIMYQVRKSRVKNQERGDAKEKHAQHVETGLDADIYCEPTTGPWHDAWNITEHIFAQWNEEVVASGAKLLVVTLSNSAQVHPDIDERAKLAKSLGVKDLGYPDRRIEQAGKAFEFDVLTLSRQMAEFAEKNSVYLHGFENSKMGAGHWNSDGHALAAELIAAHLREHGAPK